MGELAPHTRRVRVSVGGGRNSSNSRRQKTITKAQGIGVNEQ